jgi:hypothetical protein
MSETADPLVLLERWALQELQATADLRARLGQPDCPVLRAALALLEQQERQVQRALLALPVPRGTRAQ